MSAFSAEDLAALHHDRGVLQRNGILLRPYTSEEIEQKRQCDRCGSSRERDLKKARVNAIKTEKHAARKAAQEAARAADDSHKPALETGLQSLSLEDAASGKDTETAASSKAGQERKKHFVCKYHLGTYRRKDQFWTCCRGKFNAAACGGADKHNFERASLSDLLERYQAHQTPEQAPGTASSLDSQNSSERRAVVAVDCEMGTNVHSEPELIRVSLVDVLSSQTLLDSLVWPRVDMQHYNTRYSGVSRAMIEKARKEGKCLRGAEEARDRIWRFVGPSTLLIGHGVVNDLKVLRWIHTNILDTSIMARQLDDAVQEAKPKTEQGPKTTVPTSESAKKGVETRADPEQSDGTKSGNAQSAPAPKPKPAKGEGKFALKSLSARYLQRQIQTGTNGHDSVEDALAAGDLALALAVEYKALIDSKRKKKLVMTEVEEVAATAAAVAASLRT